MDKLNLSQTSLAEFQRFLYLPITRIPDRIFKQLNIGMPWLRKTASTASLPVERHGYHVQTSNKNDFLSG